MADKEITIKVTTEADASQVDDLSTKMDELTNSANEAANTIDNTTSSVDELSESTGNVNGESFSGASEGASQLGENASQADESVQQLNEDLGIINGAAMLSVAGELSQLGSQAEGLAQDMNTASINVGQLATNTGIAEPQLVSMINTMTSADFPHEDALTYISALNQMGVSASNLESSATAMDVIGDATGMNADKVVSLTQSLRGLGVSADNLPSAFNAIAFAQANVTGGADSLTTVLKRQAGTLNEYGLNADQTVIILKKLSESGVQQMKLGSTMSQILKENNGDLSAVEQQLGLTAGTLQNASQVTGEYTGKLEDLAAEEGAHKTIVDQLGAVWEDLSLQMAPVLSPMASFMGLIGQAGSWAVGVNGIVELAGSLGKFRNAQILSTIATKAGAAAQWLMNAAMSANPITLVVIAIMALILVLGYLYFNNEQVRNAINALGQSFILVGQIIYTSIMNAVNWVIGALQNLWNYIFTLGGLMPAQVNLTGNQIIDSILRVVIFISTLPIQIGIIFMNLIARALGFGNNFSQRMISAGSRAVSGFFQYISQLPGKLAGELQKMIDNALNFASNLPSILRQAALDALNIWEWITGEHSPGYMYDMFTGELSAMENAPTEYSSGITRNMGAMATSMMEGFNDTDLSLDFENTSNSSINNLTNADGGYAQGIRDLILNIGTVDSEERIQEIVDAIIRILSFDNKTAGRTV